MVKLENTLHSVVIALVGEVPIAKGANTDAALVAAPSGNAEAIALDVIVIVTLPIAFIIVEIGVPSPKTVNGEPAEVLLSITEKLARVHPLVPFDKPAWG